MDDDVRVSGVQVSGPDVRTEVGRARAALERLAGEQPQPLTASDLRAWTQAPAGLVMVMEQARTGCWDLPVIGWAAKDDTLDHTWTLQAVATWHGRLYWAEDLKIGPDVVIKVK